MLMNQLDAAAGIDAMDVDLPPGVDDIHPPGRTYLAAMTQFFSAFIILVLGRVVPNFNSGKSSQSVCLECSPCPRCCGSPAALLFSSTDVSYRGLGSLLPPPGCPRDPVL